MIRVELYARPDCPTCEQARAVLERLRGELPFELLEVDVTLDPAVERRYRDQVPVVFVDGRRALKAAFAERDARKKIERALTLVEGSERADQPAIAPRTLRRVKLGFAVVAALAIPAVLGLKAWDLLVTQPRLVDESFDITRITPLAAPEFRLEQRDGSPLTLASLRGQVLLVNFWATWCPPCRDEMPSMVQFARELTHRFPGRFRMLAVSVDEGWEPIGQFFTGGVPSDLTVVLDRDQSATRAYYCAGRGGCPNDFKFPESYIIDGSGRMVAFVVGPRNWSERAPRRFLERLLD